MSSPQLECAPSAGPLSIPGPICHFSSRAWVLLVLSEHMRGAQWRADAAQNERYAG